MQEYLPLVDASGNIYGKALRSECHGHPALIHPVVHLHVMDSAGRLLIQRRSEHKDLYPGFWDTAVGGHVAWGEDVESALQREADEELGVDTTAARFLYSYINSNQHETEFVSTYLITNEGPFHLNTDEVAEVRFWTMREIAQGIGKKIFTPNFEEEFKRLDECGLFGSKQ